MLERQVRDAVLRKLKKEGWTVMSLSERWASGYPDLLCIYKGMFPTPPRYVFLELKRSKGGDVKPIQKAYMDMLKSLGCEVYLVNDVKQLEEII